MRVRSLLLAVLLLIPVGAGAQNYAIQGAERYFRVEASPSQGRRGPILTGYIYNTYGNTADRVWVTIDALDGTGHVVSSNSSPILGTIPNGSRTYFELPAPPGGTTYRARVTYYEWVGRGGA